MNTSTKRDVTSTQPLYFNERGSGPPLLLVHGLMATGEMFDPVVEHFATRHRLIVPDLRGHGRSRNLPPPYTSAQLASDLVHLLDHLGIESAAVLGYSMGGAVAQQFAVDHPERCNRMVLGSTYTCNTATFGGKIGGLLFPFLLSVVGMRGFAKLVSLGTRQMSKERSDWLVGIVAGQDRMLMLPALKETLINFDSRHRLVEIKCPTLVVVGSADRGDVRQARMLHAGIAGSKLVVLEKADHALMWSRTDEFVRIVDEFING